LHQSHPLIVSGRLTSDRGAANNGQPDRRVAGEVLDAMRHSVQGVAQLGQALKDFADGKPIRAVDEDGNLKLSSDSTGHITVTGVYLRRTMSRDNPLWGAPRIHGELLKLGIDIAQSTVAKYMPHRRGPPSPGWRAFLRNHTAHIAAIDLFVIPTIGFKLLYGLVILGLERRRLVWTNVTRKPTAEWIARQITEAFPWDAAPRYLIRDRDTAYGVAVTRRLRTMGIRDRPIAPRSPWQNGHAERLIGSIRRECLDHVVVLGESHLRDLLANYRTYYNEVRTHVALGKDAPLHRPVLTVGRIASVSWLGGLSISMFGRRDRCAHHSRLCARSDEILGSHRAIIS
jgi:transposase InsO family protein